MQLCARCCAGAWHWTSFLFLLLCCLYAAAQPCGLFVELEGPVCGCFVGVTPYYLNSSAHTAGHGTISTFNSLLVTSVCSCAALRVVGWGGSLVCSLGLGLWGGLQGLKKGVKNSTPSPALRVAAASLECDTVSRVSSSVTSNTSTTLCMCCLRQLQTLHCAEKCDTNAAASSHTCRHAASVAANTEALPKLTKIPSFHGQFCQYRGCRAMQQHQHLCMAAVAQAAGACGASVCCCVVCRTREETHATNKPTN